MLISRPVLLLIINMVDVFSIDIFPHFVVATLNDCHSITVPIEIPEELALEANESPESFREFVVNYAKIEVL